MDQDLAATYSLIHAFLKKRSHTKAAEAVKKAAKEVVILKDDVVHEGPHLDEIIGKWRQSGVVQSSEDESSSSSDSDSSDSEAAQPATSIKKTKAAKPSVADSSSESSSDSESESEAESIPSTRASVKAKQPPTQPPSSRSSSSDSDSDDTDVPATKAVAINGILKNQTKAKGVSLDRDSSRTISSSASASASSSNDSDSDDSDTDTEVKAKESVTAQIKKSITTKTKKDASSSSSSSSSGSDSDSSSSDAEPTPSSKSKKAVSGTPKSAESSSSSSSESESSESDSDSSSTKPEYLRSAAPPPDAEKVAPVAVKKRRIDIAGASVVTALAKVESPPPAPASTRKADKRDGNGKRIPNERFQRVDASKHQPVVSDNSYVAKVGPANDYGKKAHDDLIVTRGAGFRKEKNKKKRGSYRGGEITMASHSFKFSD